MKYRKFLIIILLVPIILSAQSKKFTMEDVVFKSYSSLAPERMNQLSWVPNSENLSFVEDTVLISHNSKTGEKKNLISLDDLNSKIAESKLGDELRRFPRINWMTEDEFSFWNDTTYLHFNLSDMSVSAINQIPSKAANREVANNNKFIAYTIDNDLFVSLNGNSQQQITNEVDKGIVSGQSVSRNEFGISGGIFLVTQK